MSSHSFRCQSTFDGRIVTKGTLERARAIAYDMLIRLVDGTPRAQPTAFPAFQRIWQWQGDRPLFISIGTHVIAMEPTP